MRPSGAAAREVTRAMQANGANDAMRRVVVVGGGLAGLVAATYAARAGRPVMLCESISEPGGRARTRDEHGFLFNMGPHALYRASVAAEVLRELGVEVAGALAPTSGGLVLRDDALHALPAGVISMLTTGLLRATEKIDLARFFTRVSRLDTAEHDAESVARALQRLLRTQGARAFVAAFVRLTSYANAPAVQSGGAALRQIQLGLQGVRYLDGGWRSLVAALGDGARKLGVDVRTAARVLAVEPSAVGQRVRLASGEEIDAACVVLALGPADASALVEAGRDPALARFAAEAVPARAACLDVGLRRLPRPDARFLLGIDEPLYYSVHSAVARLAPEGGALIHVARYLRPDEDAEREATRARLEALLDRLQPGWREQVVTASFARELRVSHAIPLASQAGRKGRPAVVHPKRPGLFLAGDWVGPDGELADASFASGRAAGVEAARFAALREAA